MFKKLLAVLAALFAAAAFAAVDVNKATQAELEAIKGIGPAIAGKILDERKKGSFKDWPDLIDRVKGVGEGNAAKFSADGLTVGGSTFKGAPAPASKPAAPATMAAPAAPAAATAKPAEKAAAAAPAAPAAKADAKAMAKDEKKSAADEKKAKADAKAEKKAAAKAEKEAKAKQEAADKEAKKSKAKDAKKADKPEAAASAAKK